MDIAGMFNAPPALRLQPLPAADNQCGIPHQFRFFHVANRLEIRGSPCLVTCAVDNKQPYSLKKALVDPTIEIGMLNVERLEAVRAARLADQAATARAERFG